MPASSPTQPTLDETILRQWIGNERVSEDLIDCRRANLLKATLDPGRADLQVGDPLPAGWHWIYFPEASRMDTLGRDGHAALGGFLPPIALPRRMWAGTRLRFHGPVWLEEEIRKVSTLVDVRRRTGRSGELCFVTVNHRYFAGSDLRLEEDHDIVYRSAASAAGERTPARAESESDHSMVITPSATLLFRYSALTFNGHRIHYDIDFCRDVEGYPGLVVHAPLTATLMLGLAQRNYADSRAVFAEFRQKSVSPLFHGNPFTIHLQESASGCRLWAANHEGALAATADLTLR
jgi:3-methylfumaryl-CoA hydratase